MYFFFSYPALTALKCVSETSVDLSVVHVNLAALQSSLSESLEMTPRRQRGRRRGEEVTRSRRVGKKRSSSTFLSAPWPWLGVDLSPKLNFLALPSLRLLRAARCQPLLFSYGQLLREHAHICGFRGLAAECAAPVKPFRSDLAQHPN